MKNDTDEYEVQQFVDKENIQCWADFCGKCFAGKNPEIDSSFFERKIHNDPQFQPEYVFVIRNKSQPDEAEGKIIGTLRLYKRNINWLSIDNQPIVEKILGIGEVCVDPDFRRKGLAKKLLNASLSYGKGHGYKLMSLHCAEWAKPVYESVGFQSADTFYYRFNFEDLQFPEWEDPPLLIKAFDVQQVPWEHIAGVYNRNNFFIGTTHRSESDITYWNQWIRNSMMYRFKQGCVVVAYSSVMTKQPLGYIFAHRWEENLCLSEIACDGRKDLPLALLKSAVATFSMKTIRCPKYAFEKYYTIKKEKSASIEKDNDSGWLYKCLTESSVCTTPNPHLVWPTDNF